LAETIRIRIVRKTTAQKRQSATDRRRLQFELGRLVQTWGLLQESLIGLFEQATECPSHVASSMWHSIKSDLVQRELLLAALQSSTDLLRAWKGDLQKEQRVLVFDEYIWGVMEINKLSHTRNDLIHSPIVFYWGVGATVAEARVWDQHNNPRAVKLKDKELYQLSRWICAKCDEIKRHLASLWTYVRKHGKAPPRPKFKALSMFPTRGQKPARAKARPRRKNSIAHYV
jgi:hypothetical protein